jgi:hypothetical protein
VRQHKSTVHYIRDKTDTSGTARAGPRRSWGARSMGDAWLRAWAIVQAPGSAARAWLWACWSQVSAQ